MCTPTDFKNTEYRKMRVVSGTTEGADAMRIAIRDGWRPVRDTEWTRFTVGHARKDPVFIFTFERPLGDKK